MTELAFRDAVFPLLAAGEVDVLEWSFDVGWDRPTPDWQQPLLDHFAAPGRLLGHGVSYSLLSGDDWPRQAAWLERVRRDRADENGLHYRHVSEHFGFMTAGDFDRGPPLPIPMTAGALALGRDRLERLVHASGCQVGIENLAFAFSADDVAIQGEFIDRLLEPVSGFMVLDLHNLHCQAINFGLPVDTLMRRYPLERVREIHVSGGSWHPTGAGPVRRDTHDGPVPGEVIDLLDLALAACPHVEAVILERLGDTLAGDGDSEQFRHEFRHIRQRVAHARPAGEGPAALYGSLDSPPRNPSAVVLEPQLGKAQGALLQHLGQSADPGAAAHALTHDPALGDWRPHLAQFDARMLESAMQLVDRWGRRRDGRR